MRRICAYIKFGAPYDEYDSTLVGSQQIELVF